MGFFPLEALGSCLFGSPIELALARLTVGEKLVHFT